MIALRGITWLFFDMGGTLNDETEQEKAMVAAARDALVAEGIHVSCDDIYRLMIDASIAYQTPHREAFRQLTNSQEQFERVRVASPYPAKLAHLYAGVPEMLAALSGKYRLGVIANQGAGMEQWLTHLGIHQYFSVFAGSRDVGLAKPDQAIFRWALDAAGCAPSEAVMIGDRLDNDIYPAKSLGLSTVWVKQGIAAYQTPKSVDYMPDYTIERITELAKLF